jgi:hypothetical protein
VLMPIRIPDQTFLIDADPVQDPDPGFHTKFLHMLENLKIFLTFVHSSASLDWFIFLVTSQMS